MKSIWKLIMNPDSKVHGANMGPIWGRQDPDGPHVGPMILAVREGLIDYNVALVQVLAWYLSGALNQYCLISTRQQHIPSMTNPDSKVHRANMGPTWVLPAPDGPHVGPINLAIREVSYICASAGLISKTNGIRSLYDFFKCNDWINWLVLNLCQYTGCLFVPQFLIMNTNSFRRLCPHVWQIGEDDSQIFPTLKSARNLQKYLENSWESWLAYILKESCQIIEFTNLQGFTI